MKKVFSILALVLLTSLGSTSLVSCTADTSMSDATLYEKIKATDGDDVPLIKRSTDGDDVPIIKRSS